MLKVILGFFGVDRLYRYCVRVFGWGRGFSEACIVGSGNGKLLVFVIVLGACFWGGCFG